MEQEINVKLEAALYHQAKGRSVIPTGPDKRPLINWQEFQTRRASREEILEFWRKYPNANPAIVTGAISGLVVLDIDAKHNRSSSEFKLPPTACATSGNNGEHIYFKHPGATIKIKNCTAIAGNGVDIRGDGGYIVVPPSVNQNGGEYSWNISLDDGVADMPEWLLGKVKEDVKKWEIGANGVSEGARNETAASMAGKILSHCASELWESLGWEQLKVWNNKNVPPMDVRELRRTWESIKALHIKGKAEEKSKKINQADKLVEIARNNPKVLLFRSELDEPFIQFPVGSHTEYWACKDKRTRWWLSQEFWNKYGTSANNDAISTALNTLQGFALFKGEQFILSNRVSMYGGDVYYSLSNDEWEAIRISKDGWKIVENPPILFRRYTHQKSQVVPNENGDVKDIFRFINIKSDDDKLLFVVWLVSCFIPDFPHTMLYLFGPQGSAKSTASRLLKKIIDPSKIEVAEIPRDQKELVQKLSHHWCLIFDNVSDISDELSDLLCRAVTGSGFSKRELYSDDSDIIYTFKRCLGINGINLMVSKPDLFERSILIELERVPKDKRMNEQDLYAEFNTVLPGILGSIMGTVSDALRIRPTVQLQELPRMADFALWGYAISEALGYGGQSFIDAYYRNIGIQHQQAISEDFVASFIVDLMTGTVLWEGSATELVELMKDSPEYDEKQKNIPKTPQSLSRQLNVVKTNLAEAGVQFERISGRDRKIILRKMGENSASTASTSPESEMLFNPEDDF
jgi:hypothetical protein